MFWQELLFEGLAGLQCIHINVIYCKAIAVACGRRSVDVTADSDFSDWEYLIDGGRL